MVEYRGVSKRRYVIAVVLTFLIFSLGLMLGIVIEGKRVEVSQQRAEIQRLDLSSLQLQYAYINQLALENNCPGLAASFDENVETLEETRSRLEGYYNGASVNRQEFDIIRREYTIAQFNYWLFAEKYKGLCSANLTTIIFFYDDDSRCPTCSDQGFVLSYLKSIFRDKLLNFAVYGRYDSEPMVDIVKDTYGVESYPALIIEDRKFEGFMSREELRNQICIALNNSDPACG